MRRRLIQYGLLIFCLSFAGVAMIKAEEESSYFGTKDRSSGGLIGILYDIKVSQSGEYMGRKYPYQDVVREFVECNWDEAVLNRFFRWGRSLNTTQIFIPKMSAEAAPAAFGAAGVVQPKGWLVHYKGQVSPG